MLSQKDYVGIKLFMMSDIVDVAITFFVIQPILKIPTMKTTSKTLNETPLINYKFQ